MKHSRLPKYMLLLSLAILLLGAVGVMINGWSALPNVHISGAGQFALVGGVVISFLVGGGLMALVFYSARKGYDDAIQTPFKPEKDDDKKPRC